MTSVCSTTTDEVNPRFTVDDVGDPNAVLRPIEGYQNADKLSLEEATKSIGSLFQNLERDVCLSKKATETLKNYLSHDESAAIHLYTMELEPRSLYSILNELLRAKDRKQLEPWFPYLNLILNALFKMPSVTTIVWRGVKAKLHHLYEEGKFYIWWPFTSCTLSVDLLENPMYLGDSGDRTLFSIECFSGKAIKTYSYYQYEDEILLLPGTYLEVIGKAKVAEGLYIIRMREVNPPHVLLEPPIGFQLTQDIEFILDSVYEVNKENDNVPKLFIILPDPSHSWDRTDPMKNKFLLHFVCECSINDIHLAHYPGYAIPYPLLFFQYYNRYMQQFMVPLTKRLFQYRQVDSIHNDAFWNTFMQGVSEIQIILSELPNNENNFNVTMTDTRELPDFLLHFENSTWHWYSDNLTNFSNLCRSVTIDMVVRWVCTRHYPVDQLEAINRFNALNTKVFDQQTSYLTFYHAINDVNGLQYLKDLIRCGTRCYHLILVVSVSGSVINLIDEIQEILCKITCLSVGGMQFRVDIEGKNIDRTNQLLSQFLESNMHCKRINAARYLTNKLVDTWSSFLTLRSLLLADDNHNSVLRNKLLVARLSPKLSSLVIQSDNFSPMLPNLCELIRASKKLNLLTLMCRIHFNEIAILTADEMLQLSEAICANSNIRKLRIDAKLMDGSGSFLASVIRSCSNLVSLSLEITTSASEELGCIMKEIAESANLLFVNLRAPHISHGNYKQYIWRTPIAQSQTMKSRIITFGVSDVQIPGSEMPKLVDNLKTSATLSHLSLQNVLTAEQLKSVVNALCFNTSLITLDLSRTEIDSMGSKCIAELLQSKTSNLHRLNLRSCGLTDTIASPLLNALAKNRRITHLYLDCNNMGNDSANRIAAIIVINMSLTCFSVMANQWDIEGFTRIAQSLLRNSTMTEFFFCNTPTALSLEIAETIYKSLSENTTIVRSSLHDEPEESLNVLRVKRPDLVLREYVLEFES